MQYNLLYYDTHTSFCTEENNPVSRKDSLLKILLPHAAPDILSVNELNPRPSSHRRILDILNTRHHQYKNAAPTGEHIGNGLFYNSEKFTRIHQDTIPTSPRITDVYTLEYIPSSRDPVRLICVVTHLKAGDSAADEALRSDAATLIMNYLRDHFTRHDKILIMGDFNTYSAADSAYKIFTEELPGLRCIDPLQSPGDWSENPDFAHIHTQSPRLRGPCFAGGGLDDRFDFILASTKILDSERFRLSPSTYTAMGQDGRRLNKSLVDPPNNSAPDSIIQALYGISDHLPVIAQIIARPETACISESQNSTDSVLFEYASGTLVPLRHGFSNTTLTAEITTLQGRHVFSADLIPPDYSITVPRKVGPGTYILRVRDRQTRHTLMIEIP
jgi:endonuclease/exonuclease/phosphatase family metal-dependent hydrolase